MFWDNGFMEYMGYRNMVVENKIDECLAAARRGEKDITVDRDDLTDDELEYVKSEFYRRLG